MSDFSGLEQSFALSSAAPLALLDDFAYAPPPVSDDVQPHEAKDIKPPTLVLWTEHNPGDGPEVGRDIASHIPGSKFECISDAGHWPQWEHPEEHDAVITKFFKTGQV